ncbi:hypothetical protein LINPERPRIM_LOCUS17441, partial [Linum perenne]
SRSRCSELPSGGGAVFGKISDSVLELRKKDRLDLNNVMLPELCRLRELAEERMASLYFTGCGGWPQYQSNVHMSTVSEDII